ncbi:MAG: patatin-like phospholipase family protein [bacterium]
MKNNTIYNTYKIYLSIILIILLIFCHSNSILANDNVGNTNPSESIINQELLYIDTPDSYIIEKSGLFQDIGEHSIGLALGGGGARAYVNIGVLKALEEKNIPIDFVSGTSMGAIIATLYGSGIPVEDIEYFFKN